MKLLTLLNSVNTDPLPSGTVQQVSNKPFIGLLVAIIAIWGISTIAAIIYVKLKGKQKRKNKKDGKKDEK